MTRAQEETVSFESEGLRLVGAMRPCEGSYAAVVMHPHPQYGGDMDSYVVLAICRAMQAEGVTTLRFNFRGTGGSAGSFDGGRGEMADAEAAVRFIRARLPSASLLLAGYSFGAAIAAATAERAQPRGAVLVSLPAQAAGASLPGKTPTLVVTGSRDPIAPPEPLQALAAPGRRLAVVEDADHFWMPGVSRLGEIVGDWVRNLESEQ